jgi:hypothetical protein
MARLSLLCVLLAVVAFAASGVNAKGEPTIKETVAREMHHNHDMNEVSPSSFSLPCSLSAFSLLFSLFSL